MKQDDIAAESAMWDNVVRHDRLSAAREGVVTALERFINAYPEQDKLLLALDPARTALKELEEASK